MQKIWVIAPFTEIEKKENRNRFEYISKKLYELGYEVHLFTSDYIHLKWKYRDKKIENNFSYKVHLIHEVGYKKTVSPKRAISHISFALNLMKKVKSMEKPDLIYCAYPTMTSAFLMEKYAQKNKIPFFLDVQDTWPESISAGINTKNLLVKLLMFPFKIYADMIYRNTDLIFGVSETYVNRAKVKKTKAKEFISVYIGAEGSKFEGVKFKNLKVNKNEIWIIYIGTLSHSYDIETAINTFNLLDNKNIKLYILGDGPDYNKLEDTAKRLNLLNKTVFLKGMLSYEKMLNYLKSSDIALNAIKNSALQTITNKFGDYVSAGLPILNCGSSLEVKKLINEKKLGINYIAEDSESLKMGIIKILSDKSKLMEYSKNCKKLSKEKFDRNRSYQIIFDKIEEILKITSIDSKE